MSSRAKSFARLSISNASINGAEGKGNAEFPGLALDPNDVWVGESSKRRRLVWSWLMGVPGCGKLNIVLVFDMLAGSVGVQGIVRCEGGAMGHVDSR